MPTLPLEQMTVKEKLQAMEELWSDLCCNQNQIPVPQWHIDILDEREKLIKEGKAKFVDWETAKKRIAARIMKIHIIDQAEDDLVEGYNFYEDQAPGVGIYFLDCIYSDIESLVLYAGIHRIVHKNYRRMLSERFPFAIYYTVSGDKINIHAIIDCRRDPAWIRDRLSMQRTIGST